MPGAPAPPANPNTAGLVNTTKAKVSQTVFKLREAIRKIVSGPPAPPPRGAGTAQLPSRALDDASHNLLQLVRNDISQNREPSDAGRARQNLELSQSIDAAFTWGDSIRTLFEDQNALWRIFLSKFYKNFNIHPEDIPILRAYILKPSQINQVLTRMHKDILDPTFKLISDLANKYGMSFAEMGQLIDHVATTFHVIYEGNQTHRASLVANIEKAKESLANIDTLMREEQNRGAKGPRKKVLRNSAKLHAKIAADLTKLTANLELYDLYQNGSETHPAGVPIKLNADHAKALGLKPGSLFKPAVAGGVSLAARMQHWQDLHNQFTEAELMRIVRTVTSGFEKGLRERINAGFVTKEMMDTWPKHNYYVPLITDMDPDIARDNNAGYLFNPSRTDYDRYGSTIPAKGAVTLLIDMVQRVSNEIGSLDYNKEAFNLARQMDRGPIARTLWSRLQGMITQLKIDTAPKDRKSLLTLANRVERNIAPSKTWQRFKELLTRATESNLTAEQLQELRNFTALTDQTIISAIPQTNNGLVLERLSDLMKDPANLANKDLLDAPGIIWYQRFQDPTTKEFRVIPWKITVRIDGDPNTTRQLRESMIETRPVHPWLKTLQGLNRIQGRLLTTLRVTFAPLISVKDVGERLFNNWSRGNFAAGNISGPRVVANMLKLLVTPGFWAAYMNGQFNRTGRPGKFNEYYELSKKAGIYYTILSQIKNLGRDINRIDDPRTRSLLAQGAEWIGSTKPVKVADALITKYNDIFNSMPLFLNFAALLEAGVPYKDAASYTYTMMDYYKKGRIEPIGSAIYMFFRPTIQGGANLLRSLLPYGKHTLSDQFRGSVTFIGGTLLAMQLISMLSLAAGDNDEGVNRYDALPFETKSRALILFDEDGSQLSLPLPFGGPGAMYGVGHVLFDLMNGRMEVGEAAYQAFISFTRQVAPEAFPAYSPSKSTGAWTLQSFFPQILRPFADTAVNKTHWGTPITYGSNTTGLREFEKGRKTTPIRWHRLAREMAPIKDMTPEEWQYFAKYYLVGPAAAVMAAMDVDTLLENPFPKTQPVLGPLLTGIGIASVWRAEPNTNKTYYLTAKNDFKQELLRRGVRDSGTDTKPGERAALVRRNMRNGGFTSAEIAAYQNILDTDKALKKLNDDVYKKYKHLRFGDEGWDYPVVKAAFTKHAKETQALIDEAVRKLVKYPRTTF
jgi:hypothetical protein